MKVVLDRQELREAVAFWLNADRFDNCEVDCSQLSVENTRGNGISSDSAKTFSFTIVSSDTNEDVDEE